MSETKADLKRDSTMHATAKEGMSYLKASKKDTLIKYQGLDQLIPSDEPGQSSASSGGKPSVRKSMTMQQTAKEGIDYLKSTGKRKLLQEQGLVAKMQRAGTMTVTAEEGGQFLKTQDVKLDEDAKTRHQQDQLNAINSEQPPAKKAKGRPMAMKKSRTMAQTLEEAKSLLKGVDTSSGRQTRSQAKGIVYEPPKKRERPAKGAAKKPGKRGRPPKEKKEDAELPHKDQADAGNKAADDTATNDKSD